MRIGVAWEPHLTAATYRAISPLRMMERRGHTVVWPPTVAGEVDPARHGGCDVVHVYRRADRASQDALRGLSAAGVAITWDNDDDLSMVAEGSPVYRQLGGDRGARVFRATVRSAKLAQMVTVTTERLADRYLNAGVRSVEVIPNYIGGGLRPRQRHQGLVVGWVAGLDHIVDAQQLGLAETLERVQAVHADLRVECIGVDLGLPSNYRHTRLVLFEDLPDRMASFDIGLAPLADIPFNHTRSDIKVKEYAASGVAWLASDLTPYEGLGEQQGGRLVADGDWLGALVGLVESPGDRAKLAKAGQSWAKTQRIERAAERWESVFAEAVAAKRAGVPQPRHA